MGVSAGTYQAEGGFRADIQGLRALAVVLVVLYHAGLPFFAGGYVGVDVFFVISGYLITSLLWREVERTGRARFAAFYGRRARRLLPVAMLVLAFTMAASAALLPPVQVRAAWQDGIATATYWANYRFAALHTSYLSSAAPPSPFQQYWSLGVEEQFYLLWPVLLVLAARPWPRRRGAHAWHPAPSLAKAIGALFVLAAASFGLSYWLTSTDEPWAFFSLPARAWELAAGGLVALAAPALRRLPAGALAPAGWAGVAAIVLAGVAFGPKTPFPGTAALVPVLGAVGVVASGLRRCPWGPVALLGRRPFQTGGDISYSWYLWHWPFMVLLPYATGHSLTLAEGLELAVASGAIAYLSYALVEQPARRSAWLSKRPLRSLSAGASLSAAGVLSCVVATWVVPASQGHGMAAVAASPAPAAQLRSSALSTRAGNMTGHQPPAPRTEASGQASVRSGPAGAAVGVGTSGGTGAPGASASAGHRQTSALDAVEARLAAQERQVTASILRSAAALRLPANLDPPLGEVSTSVALPFVDGCLQGFTGTSVLPCEFADTSSSKTVVLFGDSHATMWFPALDKVAEGFGWRLVVWTKATCPPVEISLFSPDLGTPYSECQLWRQEVMAKIAAMHPLLVVLGIAPNYDSAYDVTQDGPAWMAGLSETISSLRKSGARVLVMGPVESPDTVVPDCLSAHPDDVPACNVTPKETHVGIGLVGYDNAGLAAEEKVVKQAGGWFANVKAWFCAPSTCPVVVGNIVVFRDNSHITVQYADYLEPLVASEVELALLQPVR